MIYYVLYILYVSTIFHIFVHQLQVSVFRSPPQMHHHTPYTSIYTNPQHDPTWSKPSCGVLWAAWSYRHKCSTFWWPPWGPKHIRREAPRVDVLRALREDRSRPPRHLPESATQRVRRNAAEGWKVGSSRDDPVLSRAGWMVRLYNFV